MQKSWILTALLNFLIAALLGLLLRYAFLSPIGHNFRFLTHAHSHVAMLGWVYLMLYTLIVHFFVPVKSKIYTRLFWITQLAVIGMLSSFPFQGYAFISITFSTLHIFASYYFVRLVWRGQVKDGSPEKRMLKAALVFMLVSTIGVWCLGPAVATLGNQSEFYNIAIQFFLHFQFNGWFLFGVFAVVFKLFHRSGLQIDSKKFNLFYRLLVAATILTMALPVSWFIANPVFLWINAVGIVLQVIAAVVVINMLNYQWKHFWVGISGLTKLMFGFALICLALKIVMQSTSLLPEIALVSVQFRSLVIGFIHLLMLGVISGFLLAFVFQGGMVHLKSKLLKLGTGAFLLGFITTELLLFVQGGMYYMKLGMLPQYYLLLFICSGFFVLGIFIILLSVFRNRQSQHAI